MKGKQGGRYYWTQMPSKTKRNIGIGVQIEKGRKSQTTEWGLGLDLKRGTPAVGVNLDSGD